ncbi:MAG: HEAT repeat domain-containing protein, partial [Bacteroidota bacterium]
LLQPTGAAPDTALAFSLAQAMAQQWVGQAIQASTPTDRWLHDGPATYLAALFEADGEADRLAMRMRQLKAAYLTEAVRYRRPLVWDQWTDAAALRDAHSTAKGAWVLHQLREQLTPLAWTRAVNAFVRRHTFSTTDSEGLRAALEEATGIAQGPYFDAWVYAAGHPMLAASYTYEARQAQLQLRVDQEQGGYLVPEAFTLPLSATVRTLAGTERLDIPVTVSTQTTEANVAMRPRYVQLDPDLGWLVEIRMEQDAPGWVAQARFGEGLVARVDAVKALADFSNDPALLLGLRSILQEAPPAPIRAALAELLGQVPPSAVAEGLLRPLLDDPSPLVRQEALRSSMAYPDRPSFRATAYRLAQTDPVPTVQGAAVVALTRLDSVSALDVVRSALITPSPQDVIRRSAFEAMSALDVPPDDAARLVAPFLAPTAPRTTRLAALHYLHTVGLATDDLRALATPLLADADPALRHAAAQTPIPLTDERWEAALGQQLAAEPCLSIQATLRRALSSSQDVPK